MPIDWLTLGAAALTGLMGGVHCAAMCGGIATGFSAMAPRGGWIAALEPNLGRVLGYTLAGVIVGAFGHGILDLARIDWLRTGLRAAVGLVLIVVALRLLDRRGRLAFLSLPGAGLWQKMRPLQRYLLPADSRGKRIALGMLWGWMPCGLSTTLLAAAWLQADAVNGGLTMAVFGLATLPVMLPLTWSGVRLGRWLQRPAWRGTAAGMILLAGLLTLTAPWLVHVPGAHALLSALGCASLPS